MHVIFVCLGNICRSPMAEAMFLKELQAHQLTDQVTVASAATSTYEIGNRPHPGSQAIMQKYDLDDRGHTARQISSIDFDHADLIIGMDDQNLVDLKRMAPQQDQHKIHGINELVDGKEHEPIPDPWYTHRFQDTYDDLALAIPTWVDYVKQQLNQ